VCRGCSALAEQAAGEDNATQAAGHHEHMALVAHAPKKYTQARGESPQEPESSGHVARQYPETEDGSWTAVCNEPPCVERVTGPMG